MTALFKNKYCTKISAVLGHICLPIYVISNTLTLYNLHHLRHEMGQELFLKLFAHEPIRHLAVVYENAGIVEWEQQRVFQCSHICQATYSIFGRGRANCICLDFWEGGKLYLS